MKGDAREELKLASDAQTGIEVLIDTALKAGRTYALVLDFDADKNIKRTGQDWIMTPGIKAKALIQMLPGNAGGGGDGGDRGPTIR